MPDHMRCWLAKHINLSAFTVESIIPEASTRQFWRLRSTTSSLIGILSPPTTENNHQYCLLSDIFRQAQVPVPDVYAYDLEQGYLLVSDVGEQDFHSVYATTQRDFVVLGALEILARIQRTKSKHIPPYTRDRLQMELGIFEEWVCSRLLTEDSKPMIAPSQFLIERMASQPKTTVHRDYHCRNLLFSSSSQIGVVDFQDALNGPAYYDVASLLYDCYFEFEPSEISRYIQHFVRLQEKNDFPQRSELSVATDAVEHCAVQRQLKAAGIFCRLAYLQQKTTHLDFVVPVLTRTAMICHRHPHLAALGEWLQTTIVPSVRLKLPKVAKSIRVP